MGGGILFTFLLIRTLVSCTRYFVKGRYCACAIAIKFVEVAFNTEFGTGGDENQVSYFIWPYIAYMYACIHVHITLVVN